MDKKYKKIYSKKIYLTLISKGHELLWVEKNRNKRWLDVFVFTQTSELLYDLTLLTNN